MAPFDAVTGKSKIMTFCIPDLVRNVSRPHASRQYALTASPIPRSQSSNSLGNCRLEKIQYLGL